MAAGLWVELLGGAVDADAVVAMAAELAGGVLIFILRASSSGLGAADEALPLAGLGSRLMTGMEEVEVLGRGAARRLLRVVEEEMAVEVEAAAVEEGAATSVDVVAGGGTDFSGSGTGVSRTFWILLMPAFFSSSRSFTVMV